MKKLISILAALALVGSLAAQKRKAPAKPAAKPVHEAVKAPAAPAIAVAPVAPAEHKAHKGIGLFIEGRGTYTMGMGTSTAAIDGDATAAGATYKLANTNGWGGGATIGYQLLKGLALVGSYDYRSIQSRTWNQTNVGAAGSGATLSSSNTTNTQILGIGFRPQFEALGGTLYAGMGFAYVLPYNDVTSYSYTGLAAIGGTGTTQTVTNNWNAGLGVYAELGYNYNITNNLYVGIGLRAVVATANNDGKSTVTTADGKVPTTAGVVNPSGTVNHAASSTANTGYSSQGITDAGININIGVRF